MVLLMSTSTNPYRLARTVVPSAYRISLTPDLDGATFTGEVSINVNVEEPVTSIRLHALDLSLGRATFTQSDASQLSHEPTLDETFQTASFDFDGPLPVGPATLAITFQGTLNDLLVGFYRST
jgi:hypothetical protein